MGQRRCRLQASCRRRSPRHPPTRPDPDASAGLDDRARGRLPPACLLSSALDRDDRIVCHLGATPVLTLPRRYRRAGDKAVRQVDYRHLIGPLVKKPQAFRHSVFREHLFPREVYRRAWEALDPRLEPRKACRVYVGLLHLAAMHGCEARLADHLEAVLNAGGLPDVEVARAAVAPVPAALPTVTMAVLGCQPP